MGPTPGPVYPCNAKIGLLAAHRSARSEIILCDDSLIARHQGLLNSIYACHREAGDSSYMLWVSTL